MSQKAKRVWTAGVVGLSAMGVAVAALLIWEICVEPAHAAPAGPGQAEALEPASYAGVSELRGRLRLSDATLAAMGCSQAAAETIFGRLRTWWETNRVAWLARRDAVAAARDSPGTSY